MNRLTFSFAVVGALSPGVLLGCGGGIDSGVPDSTEASELSGAEIDKVCEASLNYFEERVDTADAVCLTLGILAGAVDSLVGDDASIRKACSDAYATCIEDEGVQGATANFSCDGTPTDVSDCHITVGQYERCVMDSTSAYGKYLATVPRCNELTKENINQATDAIQNPPTTRPQSCEVVQEQCPDFAPQ